MIAVELLCLLWNCICASRWSFLSEHFCSFLSRSVFFSSLSTWSRIPWGSIKWSMLPPFAKFVASSVTSLWRSILISAEMGGGAIVGCSTGAEIMLLICIWVFISFFSGSVSRVTGAISLHLNFEQTNSNWTGTIKFDQNRNRWNFCDLNFKNVFLRKFLDFLTYPMRAHPDAWPACFHSYSSTPVEVFLCWDPKYTDGVYTSITQHLAPIHCCSWDHEIFRNSIKCNNM